MNIPNTWKEHHGYLFKLAYSSSGYPFSTISPPKRPLTKKTGSWIYILTIIRRWSLYIDDSEDSSSIACSSSCSEPQCSSVYNVVTARPPVAKRRKITADFIDHDLEDTASSPVCSSKVEELENLRTKFQGKDDDSANQIGELDYDSYSKFMLNAAKTYTVEQIDEVRNIWAEFTLNFKPSSNGG